MLSQALKKITRTSLKKIGLEIQRSTNPVVFDISGDGVKHPVEAVYKAGGKPCLVRVPLDRIVSFEYAAFPLSVAGGHPFLITLKEYQDNQELTAETSSMAKYYQAYQPANASEVMGLVSPSCRKLRDLPAHASPPLWSPKLPEEYLSYIKDLFKKEDESQGVHLSEFIGGSNFGPIETRKLLLEFDRLIGVYESIKKNGFRFDPSDCITGTAWVDGNDWVISVSSGQHRIASLAALGYEDVIVELQSHKAPGGIMFKSCCQYFPTVVNGLHDVKEAQIIFERILCKKQPVAAKSWLYYCKNTCKHSSRKALHHDAVS
jgi:hypothetical protein